MTSDHRPSPELWRVEAAEERSLAQIEEAFRERRDEIAAIVVEPIQGEGGDNHFRPPLVISSEEIREGLGILQEALEVLASPPTPVSG